MNSSFASNRYFQVAALAFLVSASPVCANPLSPKSIIGKTTTQTIDRLVGDPIKKPLADMVKSSSELLKSLVWLCQTHHTWSTGEVRTAMRLSEELGGLANRLESLSIVENGTSVVTSRAWWILGHMARAFPPTSSCALSIRGDGLCTSEKWDRDYANFQDELLNFHSRLSRVCLHEIRVARRRP